MSTVSRVQEVITIDCDYIHPRFAASYLVIEPSRSGMLSDYRAVIIEANTAYAVPKILKAIEAEGLTPSQVEAVIVTHIHLDHAGGAHELLSHLPKAKLIVHPRGQRHMIDPSKLKQSAIQVYGEAKFKQLYGDLLPIDPQRIMAMEDGTHWKWGVDQSRTFGFLHTRGHANHHMVVWDMDCRSVFTGDTFGLCYPELQRSGQVPFVFPSTSPTDFNAALAEQSVLKILALDCVRAYPTHFGEMGDLRTVAQSLSQWFELCDHLILSAMRHSTEVKAQEAFCYQKLLSFMDVQVKKRGWSWSQKEWDLIDLDLKINAQGLAFCAQKKEGKLK